MSRLFVNVGFMDYTRIEDAALELVDFANRFGVTAKGMLDGIKISAIPNFTKSEDIIGDYKLDMERKIADTKNFLNTVPLEKVLEKMGYENGKMKFPCYHPVLKGEGYGRYIEYYAFRSIFDRKHVCSIFLSNLFDINRWRHGCV